MNKLLLALLSGLLLAFSWPSIGVFPLVFFALVPLFVLEQKAESSKQVFCYSFFAFSLFNIITTYWIYHASIFGALAAFVINAFLMATSFWLFHKIKKISSNRVGYFSFIVLWISMEYLHLNWDLSWPWLTLGNVFATSPLLVQWYQFTGFLGGSFWVILINLLIFRIYQKNLRKVTIILFVLVMLVPVLISSYLYINFEERKDKSINILILQPNIDPYTEKFDISFSDQLEDLIALAKKGLTEETDLLIGPETGLLEAIWESSNNRYDKTYSITILKALQEEYPNLNILLGATTYRLFGLNEEKSSTARQIRNQNMYYDAYNSAIFIPDSGNIQIYHKTKLVPGAEKMPFPYILDPLAKIAVNLGGVSGSLGSDNYINSFLVDQSVVSPLICYESVYGEMKLGKTNLLAIITNDGWWKNTAGYKQHFQYARLRAVEQRKSVVRSANTGISGVINARGEILQQSEWAETVCLNAKVDLNNTITFYSKFGDYIGRVSIFISVILLLVFGVKLILNRKVLS
tara:strand:+ start:11953 stop:13509 length:1557 start_codon:yes stop_codon:yes gene_type:complete